MPTIYKPRLDHQPLLWEAESDHISGYLKKNKDTLRGLLQGGSHVLDKHELKVITNEIAFFLFKFVLDCSALSIKAPNKIAAELKSIIRDPEAFIKDPSGYSPEAAARVLSWYYKDSPQDLQVALQYEIGQATLDVMKVTRATEKALHELNEEKREKLKKGKDPRGRPSDYLLRSFAIGLADIFVRSGHKITVTRKGRFWLFVELLRKRVYFDAKAAGSKFAVRSIVEIAHTEMAKRKI